MSQSARRAFRPGFECLEQRAAPSTISGGLSVVVRRQVVEVVHHRGHKPDHHIEIHHRHEINDNFGEGETQDDNGQHGEGGAHA
jgi:hypothetical protein